MGQEGTVRGESGGALGSILDTVSRGKGGRAGRQTLAWGVSVNINQSEVRKRRKKRTSMMIHATARTNVGQKIKGWAATTHARARALSATARQSTPPVWASRGGCSAAGRRARSRSIPPLPSAPSQPAVLMRERKGIRAWEMVRGTGSFVDIGACPIRALETAQTNIRASIEPLQCMHPRTDLLLLPIKSWLKARTNWGGGVGGLGTPFTCRPSVR